MKAVALLFLILATPVFAWEYSSSPICTLTHATDKAQLTLTYNNRVDGSYAIKITPNEQAWPIAPLFMMRFDGLRPLVITTDRHLVDVEGKSLTVTDRGFGNVLDGLEFNFIATAKSGETMLIFPLTGAAPAVRRFKACVASPEI